MRRIKTLLLRATGTFLLIFFTTLSQAQDFGSILSAGLADANTYLEAYVAPGINSFASGMAGGWYNTAQAHKPLGFDLTVSINVAGIPSSEQMFNFGKMNFTNLQYSGSGNVPTMVGGEAQGEVFIPVGTTVEYEGKSILLEDEIRFDTPGGADISSVPGAGVPVPTVQLGIGIYKNTDINIRLIPATNFGDDFNIKLFGFGIKHDFKQWIPGFSNAPFDMAAFFGYTKLTATQGLDVDNQSGDGVTSSTTFIGSGEAEFVASATTFQILISKKLSVFTPYAGIGFNAIKSSIKVGGDYDYSVTVTEPTTSVQETQSLSFSDPIDLEFKSAGGPRLTVGGRLKLAILTIHFDYTLQKYSMITAGIGFSVR